MEVKFLTKYIGILTFGTADFRHFKMLTSVLKKLRRHYVKEDCVEFENN